RARMVTAPTQRYAEFIRTFWRLGAKPIQIVPNPVDEVRFQPAAEEQRHPNLVTYVGRLNRAKGIPVLLAAIPHVLTHIPTARFRLVGLDEKDAPGKAGTYERFFVQEYGLAAAQAVEFVSWVAPDELPGYYQESSITVVPSVGPDNFPGAVAEAMSCGCAVVASDIGGIPELVTHEETGLLTPPGDSEALADALIRLLRQPDLARTFGHRARQVVEQRYARAVVAEQMLAVYRQTIANGTRDNHGI
ncbi:MAG: glycosyltransferase family 4 protein, partial [Anaerolineae bacterium]